MVNAQEYINKNYPVNGSCIIENDYYKNYGKERKEITSLDLHGLSLESSLDLSDFVNLEELWCSSNELTALKLNKCLNLKKIWCYDNKLNELEVSNLTELIHLDCRDNFLTDLKLSSKNLTYLTIRNNNLSKRDLSMFSELVNLKILYINTDLSYDGDNDLKKQQGKVEKGIYNKFEGSLKHLEKLTELKELNISNTNVDSGLEYLPESLEKFYCSADIDKIDNAGVKKIEKSLRGKLLSERKKDAEELLERSKDIQKNIHQFFGGYNGKEIGELKDPKQLEKSKKFFYWTKWAGRGVAVAGGILSLTDHPIVGGGIATVYPFLEAVISESEKQLVESNESKWEEFVRSSGKLWSDYHDLMEVLKPLEAWDSSTLEQWELGGNEEVQEKKDIYYHLWTLWKKIQEMYSSSKVEPKDLLTKSQFAQDLKENWEDKKKKNIVGWKEKDEGREFQWEEIGEMLVEISKNYQGLTNQVNKLVEEHIQPQSKDHYVVDLDEHFTEKETQIEQPSYGVSSSSK